jgi:hypothetical protein
MPDITMCSGIECPLKETCYRYLAKPSFYQSYFFTAPYDKEYESCGHYWEDKKSSKPSEKVDK